MSRESGYYWVIYEGETQWEVAKWDANEKLWHFTEAACPAQEFELEKINEERILPPQN